MAGTGIDPVLCDTTLCDFCTWEEVHNRYTAVYLKENDHV